MGKWIAGLLAALLALPAFASGPGAVRKQVESSMVVTGSIDIEADGSVGGYRIDRAEEIPGGVQDMIARFAPGWRFDPVLVDGRPVKARAQMNLRLVARKIDKDSYQVSLRSATFGQDAPGESVGSLKLGPPRYPREAIRAGATGTVYLAVKVGRDGHVIDAVAEQVNLTFISSENAMTRWRGVFAKSALAAAKGWTFQPPTAGDSAGDPWWVVRVPVTYSLERTTDSYGRWQAYVPGPRQSLPWRGDALAGGNDALPADGVFQAGRELRLRTPLGEG
jgi:TonB family protein